MRSVQLNDWQKGGRVGLFLWVKRLNVLEHCMMFLKNMASVIYGNEHMITMFVLVLEIYTDVQTSRSGHVIADASVPL